MDIVILVDDLYLKDGLGLCCFDDEGVVIYKKEIISNGKLNILLYNLKIVYKVGVKLIVNGFKLLYVLIVGISVINFYINLGKKLFEEFCEDVKDGVILIEFVGFYLGVSLVIGDFFLVVKGFMIENGKKIFFIE